MLTNEKVILRIFEPADIEPVYILVMGTIDKSYTGVYPEEAIRFFKQYHCKENIYDDYLNGYTIIAELEREIVGTGTLLGANIRRVFVNKCYQGHGLGKLIMKKLENRASKRD
jgi:GNAT superfamily N-acetyltransferase